jgi:hypothetical protein
LFFYAGIFKCIKLVFIILIKASIKITTVYNF